MDEPERELSRRHHTVPKFYLRGFALDDRITTVQLPGNKRFTQSVSDASVGKDFYMLEGHPDGDDAVERALAETEAATSPVFKRILSGVWPLALEDRMLLGHFLSLQAARVPVQRRTQNQLASQLLRLQVGVEGKEALRQKLGGMGSPVSDEVLERTWTLITRPGGAPVELANAVHIEQMLKISDAIFVYIVGRPWSLVRFERRSLLTSDNPVALVPDPDDEPWQGVGYLNAWAVTFPLTRKIGLVMSTPQKLIEAEVPVERVHTGEADQLWAGTTKWEKFINYNTIVNASQWLFHHPDDGGLIPDELPEPTPITMQMDGFGAHEFTGEPMFRPCPAPHDESGPDASADEEAGG